ncbi:MAG: hypothetical protein ACOH1J_01830 [Microbacteriaceae bacterium]
MPSVPSSAGWASDCNNSCLFVIEPQWVGAGIAADAAIPTESECFYPVLGLMEEGLVKVVEDLGPFIPVEYIAVDFHKSQVIESRGAANSELGADYFAEHSGCVLATAENLDDSPSNWLGQNFEDIHAFTVSVRRDVTAN